ncbi:MAG: hypothetical protein Q6363_002775 [Candidatus Njordarchaeota archaeon]
MLEYIYTIVWSIFITLFGLYLYIRVAQKRGWVAKDAHKEGVMVVDRAGILLFALAVIAAPLIIFVTDAFKIYIALCLSVVLGSLIGLIDDFKDLGLKKAIMVMVAAVPIILLGTYLPHPYIPLVGRTRMTIVYILVIFALFSIFADACNMIDIFNGVLIMQGLAVLVPILVMSYLVGSELGMMLSLIGIGYSIGFLYWNKYPAKIFHGNIGAYGYGSLIVAIIILSAIDVPGVEFVSIVAFLPTIYNGFIYVFRTGFAPKSTVAREKRPVQLSGEYLTPNLDPDAAIDLTRIILLHGKATEKQLIKIYAILFLISSLLAILTGLGIIYRLL